MAGAYYNEIDPFAAHCLRALIDDGVIAPGDVDERSIVDVQPDDLKGFTQCHFFAGGGLWSVAARMAGISDDEQIWTGSCPCQPLSVAGQGKGADDERHLWPAFFRLIAERKPSIVFGEQVASALGREWFAGVRLDLEALGYASGAADLCAAGVGAPHIRQRLYWVARSLGDANGARTDAYAAQGASRAPIGERSSSGDVANADCRDAEPRQGERPAGLCGQAQGTGTNPDAGERRSVFNMAHPESIGRRGRQDDENEWRREQPPADPRAGSGDVGYAAGVGRREGRPEYELRSGRSAVTGAGCGDVADAESVSKRKQDDNVRAEPRQDAWSSSGGSGERHGAWSDAEWRTGADGKARRVKSGVRLLADGVPGRVGQLRIAGNAIVPQVAAAFMTASLEAARQ